MLNLTLRKIVFCIYMEKVPEFEMKNWCKLIRKFYEPKILEKIKLEIVTSFTIQICKVF